MRIVYVLTSLGIGGAERQTLALADRMAQRGHSVALLVLRPQLAEEWPIDLRSLRLNMRRSPVSVLQGMARGRAFLHDFQPDILHSHSFHANFVTRLLKASLPAPVVISTVHNVYEGGWLRMLAYRLTDSLSTRTMVVSHAAAERYVRLKAVPRDKCFVLHNAIEVDRLVPDAERRQRTRAAMGVADEFVWLTAGRIVPAKDHSSLLRAFQKLRASHPYARLWIAGDALHSEFDRVSALAAQMGLNSHVRWLGLRRDLPALLDAADAFVLSSAWEGIPLSLGEAMAMEKPVVATDVGGVHELAGECGWLVEAKSPEALAGAMSQVMAASPEERRAAGRAARGRVTSQFCMDARINQWEDLYTKVLAGRP